MTGIDKILNAIEAEAKQNAQAVLTQAGQEAEKILAAAKAEADVKRAEIVSKSDMDVKAVLSRAESAAALQEKKLLLDAKQQMINNVIMNARNSLTGLPDQSYVDILLKMVKKHAHNKPGRIVFSAEDKKRLTSDFSNLLKEALSGKDGASLTISEETAKINGGFLLLYGDIEENCSFDALFAAAKEDLQDKINAFLYTETVAANSSSAKV
jgi:V/A-type H+-transporting ATPase subunit E